MESIMDTPQSVGRYRIVDEIGRGGMGRVLRAHDPQLDRWVAVKIILPTLEAGPDSDQMKKRFLREARLAARLHHPGIVTVFDAGTEGDLLWLVMELVQGESLSQKLNRDGAPDRNQSLEIVAQVAEALSAAHAAGVIHRDIKPANILMLPDGRPKVTDFGVARAIGDNTSLTRTGSSVGSPSYMAPEQVRGEPVDARADLFSLGVIAYQLLLKRRPFPADTITTLVYQILNHDPFSDGKALERLGPDLVSFLGRALAKDRENRFSDARSMAAAARSLTSGGAPPIPSALDTDPTYIQHPQPVETPVPYRHQVLPWILAGVAGMFLTAVTALGLWTLFNMQKPEPQVAQVLPAPPTAMPIGVVEPTAVPTLGPQAATPIPTQVPNTPTPRPTEIARTTSRPATVTTIPTAIPVIPSPTPVFMAVPTARPRPTPRPTPSWAQKNPPFAPTAPPPIAMPPTPSPTSAPTPTVAPAPTSPPISEIFACTRGAEFDVEPEEALVTINGTVLGIADDWDDAGGGQTYYFPGPGRYLVKLSCPGYKTTWIRVSVSQYAEDEVVEIDTELEDLD